MTSRRRHQPLTHVLTLMLAAVTAVVTAAPTSAADRDPASPTATDAPARTTATTAPTAESDESSDDAAPDDAARDDAAPDDAAPDDAAPDDAAPDDAARDAAQDDAAPDESSDDAAPDDAVPGEVTPAASPRLAARAANQPAAADDATIEVEVTASEPAVDAGQSMLWTVRWQCSSVEVPCRNGELSAPIPASSPTGVEGTGAAAGTSAGVTATIADGTVTWTLPESVDPGTSASLTLEMNSRNYLTPDGETYTLPVTFTADNAATVADDATITVSSQAAGAIEKRRLPSDRAPLPTPGDDPLNNVTYRITAHNDPVFARDIGPGTTVLQDAYVVDQLPDEAKFVDAFIEYQYGDDDTRDAVCSVTGQDGNGLGGTVRCGPWTDPPRDGINMTIARVYLTVRYPNVVAGQEVTNRACLDAHGYNDVDAAVDECTTNTHGFRAAEDGSPGLTVNKITLSDTVVQRGSTESWATYVTNTGDTTLEYELTDRWPCPLTSPPSGSGCVPQGQRVNRISASPRFLLGEHRVTYTLSNGDTVTDEPLTSQDDIEAPAGAWITDMEHAGTLAPGERIVLRYRTVTPDDVPEVNPAGTDYRSQDLDDTEGAQAHVENCVSDVRYRTVNSGQPFIDRQFRARHCAAKRVEPARPGILIRKTTAAPTTVNIGDTLSFVVDFQNFQGTAPLTPVVADLLPAGLSYVDGSLENTSQTVTDRIGEPRVEVFDDHAGTDRQLLRVTWPDDELENGEGRVVYRFDTIVDDDAMARQFTNRLGAFDAEYRNLCSRNGVVDDLDLDGDGDTDELMCVAESDYRVLGSAAMSAVKRVRGEGDDAFRTTPAVGATGEGGTATYQVELGNAGNVGLTGVVAYDILPHVGDTAVGPGSGPRNSDWQAEYAGNLSLDDGMTVQYSASTSPCRGELFGGARGDGPAGCTDDWTPTPPGDLGEVRALRFVLDDPLAPWESRTATFDLAAPGDAVGTAFNSVSMAAGGRIDDGQPPLPTEASKVGLAVRSDVSLTKQLASTGPPVAGGLVTYRLEAANDGPATARGVVVDDQLPENLTFVAADPAADYDPDTGRWTIGDLPVDARADLSITARVAPDATSLRNVAEVTANDIPDLDSTPDNLDEEPAEDDEAVVTHEVVSGPSLTIEKATNTVDADTAETAPWVAEGGDVVWTYVVTNDGPVPIADVSVTDDQGVEVDCPGGDLPPGESLTCTATGTADIVEDLHRNTGTATGTPVDLDGNPLVGVAAPSASDDSHYRVSRPAIDVVSSVQTQDADEPHGPWVAPEGDVRFRHVVTNTGNVPVDGITLVDSNLGPITCPTTVLEPGASMTCVVDASAIAEGDHVATATVAGSGPPTVGADGAEQAGERVIDDDPTHYRVSTPSVSLQKFLNGRRVNDGRGVTVQAGSTMRFRFVVTNDGDTPLDELRLVDEQLGEIVCPAVTLDPGASMTCEATAVAEFDDTYRGDARVDAVAPPTIGVDGRAEPGRSVSADDLAIARVADQSGWDDEATADGDRRARLAATGRGVAAWLLAAVALLAVGTMLLAATRRRIAG